VSGVPPTFPFRLDALELGRNNQIPDARFINPVGNAQNHVNTYRRKQVFVEIGSASGTGGATIMRGYFHSGHAVSSLCFSYALGSPAHSGTDPRIAINLQPAAGGATLTSTIHSPANSGGVAMTNPSDLNYGERYFSLTADTDYTWWITATDLPFLASLEVNEIGSGVIDPTVPYFLAPSGGYSSIYDANRQRLHEGLSKLWKHNGATLMTWSRAGSTSATISGTTWTNVLDATTAVASTSAGYVLGSNLLAPYCRQSDFVSGYLPMATMAVYGSVSAGAGTGEVRLMSDAAVGSPTLCTVTGITTTAGWFVSNQRLGATNFGPNAFTKADLQFRMSGGANTLSLEAVALYLYET
jgi:hypothetical protein